MQIDGGRIRTLKDAPWGPGPVILWMSRDQRVKDNWALLHAQELALERRLPLAAVFCLTRPFLGATSRQYDFMLRGLTAVERDLAALATPFYLLEGSPETVMPRFLKGIGAAALVGDFDPLRVKREWKEKLIPRLTVPFFEVDAHNIVPCWIASPKQEYGAYTLRPKLKRLLPQYLTDYPAMKRHPHKMTLNHERVDWGKIRSRMKISGSAGAEEENGSGEPEAAKCLDRFIHVKLSVYNRDRNDPCLDGQSGLSPYLHFGQLSAQRAAWEVTHANADPLSKVAFLEELIVRRELSDNYCYSNDAYDRFAGFPRWAQETLNSHRGDKRDYSYGPAQLETAQTHDPLWNAAQTEMVLTGGMHGYLRMYWCKKILEWMPSPEEALDAAICLNNKYELDGRDPNGYAGIAWSIGGVHDRAWSERKVFGKIRYMSYNGCRSKFDVDAYILRIRGLSRFF